jgi:hypothetical protein
LFTVHVDGSVARLHPNKNPAKTAEVLYGYMPEWSIMGQDTQYRQGCGTPQAQKTPKYCSQWSNDTIGISEVRHS